MRQLPCCLLVEREAYDSVIQLLCCILPALVDNCFMELCPHCLVWYDDDNDTQSCCGLCGNPVTCFCDDDDWLLDEQDSKLEYGDSGSEAIDGAPKPRHRGSPDLAWISDYEIEDILKEAESDDLEESEDTKDNDIPY